MIRDPYSNNPAFILTPNWNHQWNRFGKHEIRFRLDPRNRVPASALGVRAPSQRVKRCCNVSWWGRQNRNSMTCHLGRCCGGKAAVFPKKVGRKSVENGWFKKIWNVKYIFWWIHNDYIYVVCIWWMYWFLQWFCDFCFWLEGALNTHKERVFRGSDQTADSWSQETMRNQHCIDMYRWMSEDII